jgi:hypothetical protein
MENYSGERKKNLIESKNKKNIRVNIVTWDDGVLSKVDHFFDSLDEATIFYKKQLGEVKVYNINNELMHSEKIKHRQHHNNNDNNGNDDNFGLHHHHHHHDDDSYT